MTFEIAWKSRKMWNFFRDFPRQKTCEISVKLQLVSAISHVLCNVSWELPVPILNSFFFKLQTDLMIDSRKRKGKVKVSGLNLLSSQSAFLSAKNERKVTKMPFENLLGIKRINLKGYARSCLFCLFQTSRIKELLLLFNQHMADKNKVNCSRIYCFKIIYLTNVVFFKRKSWKIYKWFLT